MGPQTDVADESDAPASAPELVVRIDRVVTRGGDQGETSLGDGSRVPKRAALIAAMGDVDEANAWLGLARLTAGPAVKHILVRIQNELFDLGADLCVPPGPDARPALRLGEDRIARLEHEIAIANGNLPPLTSFVLPGGTRAAAHLHLARTVVRRAERAVWSAAAEGPVSPTIARYLNRLSDLLFVLARLEVEGVTDERLWRPGGQG